MPYRDYRVFISYQRKRLNNDDQDKIEIEKLHLVKERLCKVFDNYTNFIILDPDRLIHLVNKLLYPVLDREKEDREWNMLEPIGDQIGLNGYYHQIHSNYVRCDEDRVFQSFFSREIPKDI